MELRAQMEKKVAQKQKEEKEEKMREMARKAREERAGMKSSVKQGKRKKQHLFKRSNSVDA